MTRRSLILLRHAEAIDTHTPAEGTPGSRFAFFADPDGNGWSVQEFKR